MCMLTSSKAVLWCVSWYHCAHNTHCSNGTSKNVLNILLCLNEEMKYLFIIQVGLCDFFIIKLEPLECCRPRWPSAVLPNHNMEKRCRISCFSCLHISSFTPPHLSSFLSRFIFLLFFLPSPLLSYSFNYFCLWSSLPVLFYFPLSPHSDKGVVMSTWAISIVNHNSSQVIVSIDLWLWLVSW